MQSQKTFANHLDDYIAMQGTLEATPALSRRGTVTTTAIKRQSTTQRDSAKSGHSRPTEDGDYEIDNTIPTEPTILNNSTSPPAVAHPGDSEPLLISRMPEMPSDDELRRLLAHPPLTYLEARGRYEGTYPARNFCELCGYWGRVKCMKCGTRVCALDCLEVHREECVTRYGL